jgi:uncharacterized membrane protein
VSATSSATTIESSVPVRPPQGLRWSAIGLVAASWISAACFGLYIVAFYLGAIPAGRMQQWNDNLPGLYEKTNVLSQGAMTAHLAAGAIVLMLGPIQLIARVRNRWPALHRWLGRVYVIASAAAGAGGLAFIFSKGTIGGGPMNAGFGLYGALMLIASLQAWRYARARRFDIHRRWAVRLFALTIGSWLYRMDYGFWLIAMHRIGHNEGFTGPFDVVMSFFFYLPNLAVAEAYLRAQHISKNPVVRGAVLAALNLATLVVAVGTYYFVRFYWGPGIVNTIAGLLN